MDIVEYYSVRCVEGGTALLIEKTIERQTLLLRLKGELDMNTAEDLRQAMDSEIERRGVRNIILDLEQVSFIDSSGLGVILGRYKKLLPLGGKITLSKATPQIYRIMDLSGLPKIIEFTERLNQDGRTETEA